MTKQEEGKKPGKGETAKMSKRTIGWETVIRKLRDERQMADTIEYLLRAAQ